MPFKIRTKLITAFIGLISVILGITGGIAYYNQRELHKAIQCSEDADERMQLVSIFQLALDRVLMPGNDYIITGDRKYVSEFETASYGMENGIKMVEESMAHLRGSLKAGEMREEEEIFRDVKLAWQNIKDISLKIFAIPDPARDKTAAKLMEEMDYKWAYPAVKRLDRLNEISRKGHKEGIEAAYKTWRHSWIIMGVGALFLFAAGISFALLYSRLFVGPIKKLHNGADAIARGEFKTRLEIKTGDELQQLAGAMNEMAEKLDDFYGTLENQVRERTRELQESEERFRVIAETAADAIITMKRPGIVTLWNKSAERIFGYPADEVIGKDLHNIIVPERYREKSREGLKGFFETGTGPVVDKTIEVFGLRKDGSEFSVELSISAMRIKDEWQAAAIVRDITERKQAEAAFRTLVGAAVTNIGAEFFHETVSSLCTWIGVECVIIGELVDEGRVRALAMQLDGKAVEHYEYVLAGTPCESATQKGYCEYHEGVIQLFPEDNDLVDIGAEAYIGTPIRDKNGKVNGILCAISRHKFVPPPMVKEVFTIIAARAGVEIERKKVEEALKYERDKLTRVFEAMEDGVYLVDQDYNIQYLNPVLLKGFGPIEGKKCYAYFHDRTEVCPWCPNQRVFAGETVRWEFYLARNGKTYDLIDTALRTMDGAIWKLEILRDISERKTAEEKLKEQLDYLERFQKVAVKREFRIKELVDEVERLKAEIEGLKKRNL